MEDDLFEAAEAKDMSRRPLAFRMRPRTLDEYVGQQHIIGPGKLLRRAIQADRLSSVIFCGPPGTGKTALAAVIANTTRSAFRTMNAVLAGVKELRYEIDGARDRLSRYSTRTILFIDEVHRWNKSQQDALLPWVENGTIILIGATTENPFFEVNAALVSRSRIFQLKSLASDDLFEIARRALEDKERGYGNLAVRFEEGALEHLVDVSKGDARSLLNALELAVETTPPSGTEKGRPLVLISRDAAEQSIQAKAVLYDKEGDYHFDVISAFIKSIRGSDPDAALYWLAKMVNAGEDPRFVFRRMMISACEDIGLADPDAIVVVEADAAAFERIGLPEGQFHLAHSAIYLATAPKSNSALGYFDALKAAREEDAGTEVPNHLRDPSRDAKGFGHGEGYKYPHAYKDHWVAQNYLPRVLQGKIFYNPGSLGYEEGIKAAVERRREAQLEAGMEAAGPENLTYSPGDGARAAWAARASGHRTAMLEKIRETVFQMARLERNDRVLILNAGFGLLVWEAWRRTPEGLVVAQADTAEQREAISRINQTHDELERVVVASSLEEAASLDPERRYEKIIARNRASRLADLRSLLAAARPLLAPRGKVVLAQTVPSLGSRLSEFVDDAGLKRRLAEAEGRLYDSGELGWKPEDLVRTVTEAGLEARAPQVEEMAEKMAVSAAEAARWAATYSKALGLEGEEAASLARRLGRLLAGKEVSWRRATLFAEAGL